MKIIYFTNPLDNTKVAKTVSDLSIEELHAIGVIEKDAEVAIYTTDNAPMHPSLEVRFFDCLTIDNGVVTVDIEKVKEIQVRNIRLKRNSLLELTDNYMVKAVGMSIAVLKKEIDKDKVLLRDVMPAVKEAVDIIKSVDDIDNIIMDGILDFDYISKYDEMINNHLSKPKRKPRKPKSKTA